MSTSTTCYIYWTNLEDYVTESDTVKATCDSALTSCTIYGSNGVTEPVKCNSQLQVTQDGTNTNYAGYFCGCGSNTITVPSIVNCADKCYNLHTNFQCNVLTLNTGFTSGSATDTVLADQCIKYRCDTTGTKCTDDGTLLWQCDNTQHNSPGSSSTKSYVCDCKGAASIPSLYQSNGQTTGKGCGASGSSASGSSASHTTTAIVSTSSSASVTVHTTSAQPTGGASLSGPGFGLLMLILAFFRF